MDPRGAPSRTIVTSHGSAFFMHDPYPVVLLKIQLSLYRFQYVLRVTAERIHVIGR